MSTTSDSFRFSYSSLTEYAQCGKRYQLHRSEKVPETPAWWLLAGTTVHALTEHFDTTGVLLNNSAITDRVFQEVEELADRSGVNESLWQKTYYDRNRTSNEMIDSTLRKVDAAYAAYVSWRMNTDIEILSVEQEVSWRQDGLHFVGFVDRVVSLPDGRVGVVDIKTGKSTPKSDMQLGFYRAALEPRSQEDIREVAEGAAPPSVGVATLQDTAGSHGLRVPSVGAYWLASTGQLTEWTDLESWSQTRVFRLGDELRRGVSESVYLPNVSDGCRTCPVKQACYAVSGNTETTRRYDPDHPEYSDEASAG